MQIPTVKIKANDGFAVINESDFDESEHVLFEDAPEVTREIVEKMARKDVVAHLDAHGLSDIEDDVKLADLRALLIDTLFVEA